MEKAQLGQVQDTIYNIFKEFDRVCRKYDIKYSMEGGTLLGAVKYQNFVPWDDDIDVIMVREEYDRFLKVAPDELNEDYFLQSYNNVPEFPLNYAKLCYKKSTIFDYDYSHLKNMCHGIFVDIFPIDNVKKETLRTHCSLVGVFTSARKTKLKVNFGKVPTAKKIVYKTLSLLPMKWLVWLVNKSCTMYNKQKTQFKYEVCNSNKKFSPLPCEMYENLTHLPFRDGEFLAVSDYDAFLQSRFGENYLSELPNEEKRKPSHNTNIRIFD